MTQTAVSHEPRKARTAPPLTVADIDQIIEGISEFIIGDSGADIVAIWQPYIEQLKAHRALIVAAPDLFAALYELIDAVEREDNPRDEGLGSEADEMTKARAAIARAEGRS